MRQHGVCLAAVQGVPGREDVVRRGGQDSAGLGPGHGGPCNGPDLPVVGAAGDVRDPGGIAPPVPGVAEENHRRLFPPDGLIHPPEQAPVDVGDNAVFGGPERRLPRAGGVQIVEHRDEHIPGERSIQGGQTVGDVADAAAAVVPLDGLGGGRRRSGGGLRFGGAEGGAAGIFVEAHLYLHRGGGHGEGVVAAGAGGEAKLPAGPAVGHSHPVQIVIASGAELQGDAGARLGGAVADPETAAGGASGGVDRIADRVRRAAGRRAPAGVDGGVLLEYGGGGDLLAAGHRGVPAGEGVAAAGGAAGQFAEGPVRAGGPGGGRPRAAIGVKGDGIAALRGLLPLRAPAGVDGGILLEHGGGGDLLAAGGVGIPAGEGIAAAGGAAGQFAEGPVRAGGPDGGLSRAAVGVEGDGIGGVLPLPAPAGIQDGVRIEYVAAVHLYAVLPGGEPAQEAVTLPFGGLGPGVHLGVAVGVPGFGGRPGAVVPVKGDGIAVLRHPPGVEGAVPEERGPLGDQIAAVLGLAPPQEHVPRPGGAAGELRELAIDIRLLRGAPTLAAVGVEGDGVGPARRVAGPVGVDFGILSEGIGLLAGEVLLSALSGREPAGEGHAVIAGGVLGPAGEHAAGIRDLDAVEGDAGHRTVVDIVEDNEVGPLGRPGGVEGGVLLKLPRFPDGGVGIEAVLRLIPPAEDIAVPLRNGPVLNPLVGIRLLRGDPAHAAVVVEGDGVDVGGAEAVFDAPAPGLGFHLKPAGRVTGVRNQRGPLLQELLAYRVPDVIGAVIAALLVQYDPVSGLQLDAAAVPAHPAPAGAADMDVHGVLAVVPAHARAAAPQDDAHAALRIDRAAIDPEIPVLGTVDAAGEIAGGGALTDERAAPYGDIGPPAGDDRPGNTGEDRVVPAEEYASVDPQAGLCAPHYGGGRLGVHIAAGDAGAQLLIGDAALLVLAAPDQKAAPGGFQRAALQREAAAALHQDGRAV